MNLSQKLQIGTLDKTSHKLMFSGKYLVANKQVVQMNAYKLNNNQIERCQKPYEINSTDTTKVIDKNGNAYGLVSVLVEPYI